MNDFSDILFLSAAMVIFSMLTMNTSRSFQATSNASIQSDLEYRAVGVAQSEIDAIRWADEKLVNPASGDYLYDNDPITKTVTYGFNNEFSEVYKLKRSSTLIENSYKQKRYKIVIHVESDEAASPITLDMEYIKTFTK
jgi:hypothetical protein